MKLLYGPTFEILQPEQKDKVHKPSPDLSFPVSLHSGTPTLLWLEFLTSYLADASLLVLVVIFPLRPLVTALEESIALSVVFSGHSA